MVPKSSKWIPLLLFTCLLYSCGKETKQTDNKHLDASTELLDSNRYRIISNFPPAAYLAAQIRKSGGDYHPELLSDISLSNRHMVQNEHIAAANLGAYVADLGYLIAYEDGVNAQRTLEVCQQMAAKLGVEKGFGEAVKHRFKSRLQEDDSLRIHFEDMFQSDENEMDVKKMEEIQVSFLTGYFIEGVYLLASMIEIFDSDPIPNHEQTDMLTPLVQNFLSQQEQVQNLLEVLARFNMEERGALFYEELFLMNEEFQEVNVDDFLTGEGIEKAINDPNLLIISDHVRRMRQLIVS